MGVVMARGAICGLVMRDPREMQIWLWFQGNIGWLEGLITDEQAGKFENFNIY